MHFFPVNANFAENKKKQKTNPLNRLTKYH